MNSLVKILSIIPILLVSLGVVFWVVRQARFARAHMPGSFAEGLANGIFLGAALFHLLPDASEALYQFYPQVGLTVAICISVTSFLLLLLIDSLINRLSPPHRGVPAPMRNTMMAQVQCPSCAKPTVEVGSTIDNSKPYRPYNYTPYLLTLLISLHALVSGIALGLQRSFVHVVMILVAILVHKGSESFALASKVIQSNLNNRRCAVLLLSFIMMTPLGIIIGLLLGNTHQSPLYLGAIFNAVAAGTFLYIPLSHGLEGNMLLPVSARSWTSYLGLPLGLSVMGLLAFFV